MSGVTGSPRPAKRTVTLRDLFWLILVFAAGFGAYRWGFQSGREYREPMQMFAQQHRLPFQLDRTSGDQLCQLVVTTIEPDSWTEVSGEGTVVYFPETNSLIVTNRAQIQEMVADLLGQLNRIEDARSKAQPGSAQTVGEFLKGKGAGPW